MRGRGGGISGTEASDRLRGLTRRWGVDVERISETPTSLLGFGTSRGRPVVLKVVRSRGEEWNAGAVAASFGGRGVVRVYEHEPGASLLERLEPGTSLVQLVAEGRDEEATGILAGVIGEMSEATASPNGVPTAQAWAEAFDRYLAGPDRQLSPDLVEEARDRHGELWASQDAPRLLHGDLHHENVLFDRTRGWVAVDPKGLAAELEYELGAALRNPDGFPALYSTPAAVRKRTERFANELDIDVERTLAWAWVQAVLSAVWLVEDQGTVDPGSPALRVAGALREVVG